MSLLPYNSSYQPANSTQASGLRFEKRASIVIVSFNSRRYLEACLRSVLETTGEDCELILVDNASGDGSADYVAAHFPSVKLIRNPVNTGFAAGNNRGVMEAVGEFIVALNPDTVVTTGWLEALLKGFEKAYLDPLPQVGLVTPRILMLSDRQSVNTCGNNVHFTGITVCRGLGRKKDDPELLVDCDISAVSGACFAIRRELWDILGGFDETLFTYLEDTDLSLRARLAGYTCRYISGSIIYHDYTNRFSSSKLFYLERNRLLLLLKIYQIKTLVVLLPALFLTEIITWGFAIKSGLGGIKAKLQVYLWFLLQFTEVKQKRQCTQLLRQVEDIYLLNSTVKNLDMSQLGGPVLTKAASFTINPFFRFCYLVACAI